MRNKLPIILLDESTPEDVQQNSGMNIGDVLKELAGGIAG
jgi:hypothetical protein